VTERVTKRSQSGACLHCHGSTTVMYRQVGLEEMGLPASDEDLAAEFNMPAVIKGFETVSTCRMTRCSAGSRWRRMERRARTRRRFSSADRRVHGRVRAKLMPEDHPLMAGGEAHPVSCIDCHDPTTMAVRVTRPGFVLGMAALAESDEPVPHLPSVEKWRRGDRSERYDANVLGTRQEMRSFVCAQCHVEYYCANKTRWSSRGATA
jgi:nitrite reductase (cytochrome c-552)